GPAGCRGENEGGRSVPPPVSARLAVKTGRWVIGRCWSPFPAWERHRLRAEFLRGSVPEGWVMLGLACRGRMWQGDWRQWLTSRRGVMDMAMFIRATELFIRLLRAVETGWRGEQETCRIILSRWGIDVQVTLESLRRGRQEPGQNGGVQRREEGLCTKREVCSYLGLGVRTLDRWIERGLLEP